MKFMKRPVVVEASQWNKDGDHSGVKPCDLETFFKLSGGKTQINGLNWSVHGICGTLEGLHLVTPGDWIITGVNGEYYPCKPDIFEKTYEPVKEN